MIKNIVIIQTGLNRINFGKKMNNNILLKIIIIKFKMNFFQINSETHIFNTILKKKKKNKNKTKINFHFLLNKTKQNKIIITLFYIF